MNLFLIIPDINVYMYNYIYNMIIKINHMYIRLTRISLTIYREES